jgi:diguanylate cyclase (GGDEF)-like protein
MGRQSKICIVTVIITLLIAFLPGSGLAMNDERKALVLLGNENLAPVVYNDNGVAKGVAVDIAEAIGDRIGHEVKVVAANWEQAQETVLNGDADGLLHINSSPKRNELFDFSIPLLRSEFSLFVQSGNIINIRTIDDLRSKRVGIEAGGYPSIMLSEYDGVVTEIIYDWKTSFRDLINGDLDAILVDRWMGEYELAQSRLSGITIVENPVETQYSRIAVKKGDIETLSLINQGLKEITEDGTVDRIMNQWQGKRVIYMTEDDYHTFFLRLVIFLLSLITLMAIFTVARYRKLSKELEVRVKERTEELHQANELLKAANIKLERISMLDGLTSIENRRAFDIAYHKTWRLCLRERMSLALIMVDIDNFKLLNDTYGHLAGDQTLMRIAEVIKGVIKRPGDLAARYGGEEFVVMLMNTTVEGAAFVAEEIRKRVEELGVENREIENVITASLGVAALVPQTGMEPNGLIEAADSALYKAKEAGRNKVVIWDGQ